MPKGVEAGQFTNPDELPPAHASRPAPASLVGGKWSEEHTPFGQRPKTVGDGVHPLRAVVGELAGHQLVDGINA
jgi:hypothetical protein